MRKQMVLLVSLLAVGAVAHAESTQCTPITAAPFSIAASGNYCLTGDLTSAGPTAISILADNVQIDLNGHTIVGPGASTGAFGIYSLAHRSVRVRNGVMRGFYVGVLLTDNMSGFPPAPTGASSRHEVSGMRVEAGGIGIQVIGYSSDIHDNVVMDMTVHGIYTLSGVQVGTAGAINVRGNQVFNVISPTAADAYGIYAGGFASIVQDNVITTLRGSTSSAGILVAASGVIVTNNRETDLGNSATQQSYQYPSAVRCLSGVAIGKVSNNITQLSTPVNNCTAPTGYTNNNF